MSFGDVWPWIYFSIKSIMKYVQSFANGSGYAKNDIIRLCTHIMHVHVSEMRWDCSFVAFCLFYDLVESICYLFNHNYIFKLKTYSRCDHSFITRGERQRFQRKETRLFSPVKEAQIYFHFKMGCWRLFCGYTLYSQTC